MLQAQALVVAGLATLFSIVMGRDLIIAHQLLLGASSMGAAAVASVTLGSVMILVVIVSHVLRINPDNIATPIAAALGDLVTLGLLSLLAKGLYDLGGEHLVTLLTQCYPVTLFRWSQRFECPPYQCHIPVRQCLIPVRQCYIPVKQCHIPVR